MIVEEEESDGASFCLSLVQNRIRNGNFGMEASGLREGISLFRGIPGLAAGSDLTDPKDWRKQAETRMFETIN
ncbi:hypothetical protein AB4Z29_31125 [Paenibacillus sp. 2TAB23]|uniref:hypothetical protein n=1 Tax=Paenibacillus sp. 2TAB23 TaxID=3233004 RepID=UPI003F9E074C